MTPGKRREAFTTRGTADLHRAPKSALGDEILRRMKSSVFEADPGIVADVDKISRKRFTTVVNMEAARGADAADLGHVAFHLRRCLWFILQIYSIMKLGLIST